MKLLVIGSGRREHALAWKLTASPRVQKVFVAGMPVAPQVIAMGDPPGTGQKVAAL